MKLSESDADLFYELNWALLFLVNQKERVIENLNEPDFSGQEMEKVGKLSEIAFSDPQWIDLLISKNPFNFDAEKLSIIGGWKNSIKDDNFFIINHSKDGTIFLKADKQPKAYCVIGIKDELEDVVPFVPVIAKTTLLPFKGKIVYQGFITIYNVLIGRNMEQTLQSDFQKAKARFGIISSLDVPLSEKSDSDEELLRYYCRSVERRYRFETEIQELLKKNPALIKAFDVETSKSYARRIQKHLRRAGVLPNTWFAVLNNNILASGKTKKQVQERISQVLPQEKTEHTHIFKLK